MELEPRAEIPGERRSANPIPNLSRRGLIDVTCITAAALVSGLAVPFCQSRSQPLTPTGRATYHAILSPCHPLLRTRRHKDKEEKQVSMNFPTVSLPSANFYAASSLACEAAGLSWAAGGLFKVSMSNYSSGTHDRTVRRKK